MTPKTIYAAVAVAVAVVLGILAYTFIGGGAGSDELVGKCVTGTVASGKSQGDAEKYCKCSVDIMRSKLSSDQIDILMMQMKGDAAGAQAAIMKQGQEGALKTAQAFVAFAQEAEKACNK